MAPLCMYPLFSRSSSRYEYRFDISRRRAFCAPSLPLPLPVPFVDHVLYPTLMAFSFSWFYDNDSARSKRMVLRLTVAFSSVIVRTCFSTFIRRLTVFKRMQKAMPISAPPRRESVLLTVRKLCEMVSALVNFVTGIALKLLTVSSSLQTKVHSSLFSITLDLSFSHAPPNNAL